MLFPCMICRPLQLLGGDVGYFVVLVIITITIIMLTATKTTADSSQLGLIKLHVIAEGRVED
jgi:hypothetical protein